MREGKINVTRSMCRQSRLTCVRKGKKADDLHKSIGIETQHGCYALPLTHADPQAGLSSAHFLSRDFKYSKISGISGTVKRLRNLLK